MSLWEESKKKIVFTVIGVVGTIIGALVINYLSQSAETLAEFTLAVNPPAGSSYTGTLKIDKEYSGYVVVNGDKSAISDIKYNKNDQLAFTTTINGQLLQFSGFHKPDQKDHNYAGIFLNTSGSWRATAIAE